LVILIIWLLFLPVSLSDLRNCNSTDLRDFGYFLCPMHCDNWSWATVLTNNMIYLTGKYNQNFSCNEILCEYYTSVFGPQCCSQYNIPQCHINKCNDFVGSTRFPEMMQDIDKNYYNWLVSLPVEDDMVTGIAILKKPIIVGIMESEWNYWNNDILYLTVIGIICNYPFPVKYLVYDTTVENSTFDGVVELSYNQLEKYKKKMEICYDAILFF